MEPGEHPESVVRAARRGRRVFLRIHTLAMTDPSIVAAPSEREVVMSREGFWLPGWGELLVLGVGPHA